MTPAQLFDSGRLKRRLKRLALLLTSAFGLYGIGKTIWRTAAEIQGGASHLSFGNAALYNTGSIAALSVFAGIGIGLVSYYFGLVPALIVNIFTNRIFGMSVYRLIPAIFFAMTPLFMRDTLSTPQVALLCLVLLVVGIVTCYYVTAYHESTESIWLQIVGLFIVPISQTAVMIVMLGIFRVEPYRFVLPQADRYARFIEFVGAIVIAVPVYLVGKYFIEMVKTDAPA